MTATDEQKAPGCFGAASVYSMDSVVCQGCVAFASCGDTAIKNLEALRELVDVRDLLARHAAARVKAQNAALKPPAPPAPLTPSPIPVAQPKPTLQPVERKTTSARVTFEISEDDQNVLALIGEKSVKTREQAIVLCKTNKINNMRSMLPKGVNPFVESGPKFLLVACDMLLNGGFTKATLKARLITDLAWTDGTAGSHVAIACALLYSFKIVTADTSGAFILNPALGRDNNVSNNNERKAA
jgi:hypothetical protein